MTGEQTLLSKMLSPAVNEGDRTDALLVVGALGILAGYVLPEVSSLYGSAIVVAYLTVQKAQSVRNNGEPSKLGFYNVVEEGDGVNEGYTVLYVFGYEIVRKLDFETEPENQKSNAGRGQQPLDNGGSGDGE